VRLKLLGKGIEQGFISSRVFSEVRQDHVTGEESMGGCIACGDAFALGSFGSGGLIGLCVSVRHDSSSFLDVI
jgi:hypothetical protein